MINNNYDSYIPLYFYSLFIFALWLCLCNNVTLQTVGYSFLTMGGGVASICYIFYPSTSLLFYPIWHPASLHGLIYHWFMLFTALMVMKSKLYRPNIKHFVHYFAFLSIFCVIAVILNAYLDTNFMFLGNPFALDFLQGVFRYSPYLYASLAYMTQSIVLYFVSYCIYRIYFVIKCKEVRNQNVE